MPTSSANVPSSLTQVYYLPPPDVFPVEVGDMLGVHTPSGAVPLYYEHTSNSATTHGQCDFTSDPMGVVRGFNLRHDDILSRGSTVNIAGGGTPKRISMIPIYKTGSKDNVPSVHIVKRIVQNKSTNNKPQLIIMDIHVHVLIVYKD